MKRMFMMLALATILASLAPVARADLNGFLQGVNDRALSDVKNFNDMLSRQFGIPVPDVEAIVRSVPKPADAFMILQLGEMAHVAPATVLERYQRSKGRGWGNLARELGIKPGSAEFHALKRGNLSFTGERSGGVVEQRGAGRGEGMGRGRGHQKD